MRQVLRWAVLALALITLLQPSPAPSAQASPVNGQPSTTKPQPSGQSPAIGPSLPSASPLAQKTADASFVVLPALPLSTLPRSVMLNYRLTGLEKGIQYQASSQLRWQHNNQAYDMNLSLKVFLLGTKNWRSQGQITSAGLAPTRLTDRWRKEHTAFFDRPKQRIVFDKSASTQPLQMGAQDQISLYAQLAAAMAHSGKRWPTGTRLQIQTATVRGASPWLITLVRKENLSVDGQNLPTTQWLAERMSGSDSRIEFWVSAANDWLPVRIRITQDSGSYIDLQLASRQALPDLPTDSTLQPE